VCFIRPMYGIVLWTVVAFLNPHTYTWAAVDLFPWALAVAVPTILGFIVIEGRWEALQNRNVYLIAVLWCWFTITTYVSTHTPLFAHHAADTWFRWNFVSKVLLMSAMMVPIISNFARLRTLVIVIACCFGFFVVKGVPFLIMTGGAHRLYGPEHSMIADNNDFGLAMNMTMPFYFCLAQTESNPWVRRLFGIVFVMTIPVIFFTYSRGALVGLIATLGFMFLRVRQRLVLIPVIALGILVAVFFAPDGWKHRMDPTRTDAVDGSAQQRLNAWAYARRLAAEFPVTGGGFGTFTAQLVSRYAPEMKNIRGLGPHSVYFQILAEHGYVGLALYLALLASCFLMARRIIRNARYFDDPVIEKYAIMFQISLIAFVVSGAFLGRAYFDYTFTIAACVAVLDRIAHQEWIHIQEAQEVEPSELESEQAWRYGSPSVQES
jgi:putative inorganic carbon (hco3(-)) transporter